MKKEDAKIILIILILIAFLILITSTILFPNFWANLYKEKNSEFEGELAALAGNSCADSDGGKSYDIKGNTNTNNGVYWDSCQNSETLKEYYCNGSYSTYFLYTCPNACNDGACV